jgi:MFS transporter, DHA1 family, inner membrane transport protein
MFRQLFPLTTGALVVGCGSMIVAGVLGPIAADLDVPISLAGQLTPVYAIAFAVTAPLVSVMAARLCPRTVLVAGLLGVALANALGALAPTFEVLALARVLGGAGAAAFTPNAAAVAATLSAPERRGAAIALVFGGFSLAAVLGVPVGIWIGMHVGWRETLALISLAALLAALYVAVAVPRAIALPTADLSKWAGIARDPRAILLLAATMFSVAGAYAVFSFVGPVLTPAAGDDADRLAFLLMAFGAAGFVGNLASGRLVDRVGAAATVTLNLLAAGAGLALLFAANGAPALTIAAMVVWGAALNAITTAQQARLIAHAPALQGVLLPANASLVCVGQFVGGSIGGAVVAVSGLTLLPLAGIALVAAALALSLTAERRMPQPLAPAAARPC